MLAVNRGMLILVTFSFSVTYIACVSM